MLVGSLEPAISPAWVILGSGVVMTSLRPCQTASAELPSLGLPCITLTEAMRPAMVEVLLQTKRPRHNPGLTPQ